MTEALCLAASVALTVFTQRSLDKKMKNEYQPPLHDILHNNLPDLQKFERFIDVLPVALGVIVFSFVINGSVAFKRVACPLALIFFLRILCFSFTILPCPYTLTSRPKSIDGTNDCMFSGHTACTLLFAYIICAKIPSLKWPLLLYCLLASMLIVSTRSHYTADIIVAWIAAYAVILFSYSRKPFPYP